MYFALFTDETTTTTQFDKLSGINLKGEKSWRSIIETPISFLIRGEKTRRYKFEVNEMSGKFFNTPRAAYLLPE